MSPRMELSCDIHRAWLEDTWVRGDLARYDEWFTEGHVMNQAVFPTLPPGPAAVKAAMRFLLKAFSERALRIEDQFTEKDRVVTRFSGSARHTGPLGAAAPTGKQASIQGIVVSRFAGGQMEETWLAVNAWSVLRDLEVGQVVDSVVDTGS